MVSEREWMVWIGLVLLLVAYVLRFKGRTKNPAAHDPEWEDEAPDDERHPPES